MDKTMLYIIDIFTVDLASLHSQTPKHVLITGAPSLLVKLVGKNSIHQVVGVTMYPSRLSYEVTGCSPTLPVCHQRGRTQ